MPIPEFLSNIPELELGNELYLKAFMELSSCRALGFGVEGPIPWTAIIRWCDEFGLVGEQREDVIHLVKVMDLAFLRFSRDRTRDASKGGGSGSNPVQREDAPDREEDR